MATFKHISSKNADYGAAEQYLSFEHDEFSMKPTLDENGRLVPRGDFRIAALNCGGEDFAVACYRANLRYGKNQKREDVKSHHYIISFDPRDGPDNGLTVDRAQELGMEYAAKHFPGHQALVATHPDGHNDTGNIHVHIVINSLRIKDVPLLPYMDRPADTKAGCKHRCTDAAMEYFRSEVMELCHGEGLYQIDLLHGSKNRVTEREYWAKRKGQAALDKENAVLAEKGLPVKTTKFETDKERLRQTIRRALAAASSYDEFAALLLREGVTVKESRGRLSYLTPDRAKPITARKLGDDFDRAAVLAALEQNAGRGLGQNVPSLPLIMKPTQKSSIIDQFKQPQGVGRMVDAQKYIDAGKNRGYVDKVKVSNLKKAAASVNAYEEYGFSSREELDAAITDAYREMHAATDIIKPIDTAIVGKKELQTQIRNYRRTKPTIDAYRALKPKKQADFRAANESDFIIYETAARYFKEHGYTNKLPAVKALQVEIEALISEKNAAYPTYHDAQRRAKELQAIKHNLDQLHGTPSRRRSQEQKL